MNIFKKSDGAAAVEFAIILPFLLLLVFGVIETWRVIQANNIIANMSREGANLASRSPMNPQDIMDALASTATPLDMDTNGMIYITMVTGSAVIDQQGWNGSSYSPVSPPIADLNGVLQLDALETVYVVEVMYRYTPIIDYVIQSNLDLYSMSIF